MVLIACQGGAVVQRATTPMSQLTLCHDVKHIRIQRLSVILDPQPPYVSTRFITKQLFSRVFFFFGSEIFPFT